MKTPNNKKTVYENYISKYPNHNLATDDTLILQYKSNNPSVNLREYAKQEQIIKTIRTKLNTFSSYVNLRYEYDIKNSQEYEIKVTHSPKLLRNAKGLYDQRLEQIDHLNMRYNYKNSEIKKVIKFLYKKHKINKRCYKTSLKALYDDNKKIPYTVRKHLIMYFRNSIKRYGGISKNSMTKRSLCKRNSYNYRIKVNDHDVVLKKRSYERLQNYINSPYTFLNKRYNGFIDTLENELNLKIEIDNTFLEESLNSDFVVSAEYAD